MLRKFREERVVEEAAMTPAVAGAETSHGDEPLHACGLHGISTRMRVDFEKSVVPSKMYLGE